MKKKEPAIMANGLTNDELFSWLKEKMEAMCELKGLEEQKASMLERLSGLNERISVIAPRSCISISQQEQGPILHREYQETKSQTD